MRLFRTAFAILALTPLATPAAAQMQSDETIAGFTQQNVSFEHLGDAIYASGLADLLSSEGPYTIFATLDETFERMDEEERDALLARENRDALAKILSYHVVEGNVSARDIMDMAEAGGGTASLDSLVDKAKITVALHQGQLYLSDYQGNRVGVIATDIDVANGTIHVIDGLLRP